MSMQRNPVNELYFVSVEVKEHIILMPSYIGQIEKGIFEHLNKRILQYSPEIGGVMVAYSKPVILQNAGLIVDDNPQIHFDLKYSACVFQPVMGSILQAIIHRIGNGYIICLSRGCFSIYVPMNLGHDNIVLNEEVYVRIVKPSTSGDDMTLIGELLGKELPNVDDTESKQTKKKKKKDNMKKDISEDTKCSKKKEKLNVDQSTSLMCDSETDAINYSIIETDSRETIEFETKVKKGTKRSPSTDDGDHRHSKKLKKTAVIDITDVANGLIKSKGHKTKKKKKKSN